MSGGFIDGSSASLAADELSQFGLAVDAFERQVAVERFTRFVGTNGLSAVVDSFRTIPGAQHVVVIIVRVAIVIVTVVESG